MALVLFGWHIVRSLAFMRIRRPGFMRCLGDVGLWTCFDGAVDMIRCAFMRSMLLPFVMSFLF